MKALSLCALVVACGVFASSLLFAGAARSRYVVSSRNEYDARNEALALADEIAAKFAPLAAELYDWETHPILEALRAEYAPYALCVEDASSGLHLDFLRDEFLTEIAPYVFASGNAGGFIAMRNATGLANDTAMWKDFVKAETLCDCVCYGWLQRDEGGVFAWDTIAASHGSADEYDLFPVVNTLPLMNVNVIRGELLTALLALPSWKIAAAADKAKTLIERKETAPLAESDLRAVLRLPANHAAYRYLGVKTAFYRVTYRFQKYDAEMIIAGVPEKGSDMIAAYQIVERRLARDT